MWEGGEHGAAPESELVQGAGRGMAGKTLGRGGVAALPLQKSRSHPVDSGGAEAEEQSTGNI